jgi:hypothetical protein
MVIVSIHSSTGCKVSTKVKMLTTYVMRALAGFSPIFRYICRWKYQTVFWTPVGPIAERTFLRWEVVYVFALSALENGSTMLQYGLSNVRILFWRQTTRICVTGVGWYQTYIAVRFVCWKDLLRRKVWRTCVAYFNWNLTSIGIKIYCISLFITVFGQIVYNNGYCQPVSAVEYVADLPVVNPWLQHD